MIVVSLSLLPFVRIAMAYSNHCYQLLLKVHITMMMMMIIVIGFIADVYCYIDCYFMCSYLNHYHVFAIEMTIINVIIVTNGFCHYYYYSTISSHTFVTIFCADL